MKKIIRSIKKIKAFTLNEMLFVLAVIGILLLLAYPNLMPIITKTKAQEAKIQLKYISNLQTQFFYINSRYSNELDEIDFLAPLTQKDGGTSLYNYEIIEVSGNTFKARAQAVVDFDGDGTYNVWEIDQKGKPVEVEKD